MKRCDPDFQTEAEGTGAATDQWRVSPAPCWMRVNFGQKRQGNQTTGPVAEQSSFFKKSGDIMYHVCEGRS